MGPVPAANICLRRQRGFHEGGSDLNRRWVQMGKGEVSEVVISHSVMSDSLQPCGL